MTRHERVCSYHGNSYTCNSSSSSRQTAPHSACLPAVLSRLFDQLLNLAMTSLLRKLCKRPAAAITWDLEANTVNYDRNSWCKVTCYNYFADAEPSWQRTFHFIRYVRHIYLDSYNDDKLATVVNTSCGAGNNKPRLLLPLMQLTC